MIYIYVCRSVGLSTIVYGKPIQKHGMPKCVGGITWSKHAHAQSQLCEFETKCRLDILILPSSGRSKNTFSSNEKLRANRASEAEEQMKERLRIGREKIDIPKITRGKEKVVKTEDHEKQCLATLKRMKRCDDNELEKKLRLEKVVTRLAVETEEERRARMEKMVATKRLRLAMRQMKREKQD